jgi:hypothetical protein
MTPRQIYYFIANSLAIIQFIFALTSCSTFEIGLEKTITPNIQLTEFTNTLATQNTILATRITLPTPTINGAISPLRTPKPSPQLPPPTFTNLRFAPEPDDSMARNFYAEGAPRIFALWDYSGMQEGMLVRRVWKRNNEEWIAREEPWAYNRYGGEGTVRDIYVFENEIGLEAGEYTLTLSINGIVQELSTNSEAIDPTTFWVLETDITAPVASPDKSHTAFVRFGGNLLLEKPNGEIREIAQTQEIAAIAWFPDGANLLYVERDRSKQLEPFNNIGVTHKIFIVNIDTEEQNIIGTTGENFHSPIISPTGVYISVLSGTQPQEGCFGSPGLAIIELDSEFRRQAVHVLGSFNGLEFSNNLSSTIILANENKTRVWESDTQLLVNLEWLCKPPNQNPDGEYVLDLTNKTAERND